MFFVVLIAIIAVVAGYFVHKNFATCPPEFQKNPASYLATGISQRSAKAKKSTKSAYDTAVFDTLTTGPVSNKSKKSVKKNKPFSPAAEPTQEEAVPEEPQKKDAPSDRSSRDVKTAILPLPDEENKPSVDVKTALDISARESTAVIPTPSETLRGQLGNLPDSTAKNVSPTTSTGNTEVQADPATAKALGPESEKKRKKSKPKDGKKKKKSSGKKTRESRE